MPTAMNPRLAPAPVARSAVQAPEPLRPGHASTGPARAPRRLDELPRPRGLPLLGNLHQMPPARLHTVLESWHRELGPMYTLRLGRQPVLVCSDSALAQSVLRERPHAWRRMRAIESVLAEMGGNGVFSVEGEAWWPQRKLVMQALNPTHLRSFYPALQRTTERLLKRWQRAAVNGQVLEMREELTRYTVDVTTLLAFGEDPNTLEDTGDVIQQHLAQIFPMTMSRINAPFPYWRWLRLPRDRRLDRALRAVHAHIRGLIERNRQRLREQPGAEPANLLQALLVARDEPGSPLSDDDVSANVLTLLLAGEDTTAISLAWTMPYLAGDPALQRRLQSEADRLLGRAPVCSSLDMLRELDVFEAVVYESLRLRPTVAAYFLEPNQDQVVHGVAVPAGTPVWFTTRPDMLDARHFSQPLDFKPERWLRGSAAAAALAPGAAVPPPGCPMHAGAPAHNPRAHLQFGAGPRVCPGRHLALTEMRLVLSMLMRNFEVELACRPGDLREVMAFTMMPEHMPVRLHARA